MKLMDPCTLRRAAAHWLQIGLLSTMPVTAAYAASAGAGASSVLQTFDDMDGALPMIPRNGGRDGYLYGSPDSFGGFAAQGTDPTEALALDADGNLFGSTNSATGAVEGGTLYRFSASHQLTTLRTFPFGGTVFEVFPEGRTVAPCGFAGTSGGLSPAALLLRIGDTLHGTSSDAGATANGLSR